MMNAFKKSARNFCSTRIKGRPKKQFLFVISSIALLLFLDVKPADAGVASTVAGLLGDVAFTVVGKAVFFISYIISFIAGIFIAIEAWLIGAILNINSNLVNSAPVKFGFPVSLSIVNLGFVLGVIVIAIATILRYEQYGMKKILMKLVAAAILVNFSLVIAGVILNFADNLTGYFLQGTLGGSATNGIASANNFASAIAGAFNPQRSFITDLNALNATTSAGINTGNAGALQGIASSFGGDIGKMLTPITSLAFVVFSLVLIMITLFALIIMLVIRYVYLGILLIIMPFAWLLWVFPNFQSQWNKWWHNFLRWTFFSPIVVFFLWLGIQTSNEISKGANGTYNFAQYTSTSNPAWALISGFFTSLFSPIVENFLQMAVVLGLMLGGLFAANSFSITFANTAMGAVKSIGAGAGKWTGRLGARVATAPLRGKIGQKITGGLQKAGTGTGLGSRALRYSGIGYLGRLGGRGLENLGVAGGENLVRQYEKEVAGLTKNQTINQLTSSSAPRRIALLEKAKREGYLTMDDIPDLEHYVGESQRNLFKRYGREKFLDESKNESGITLMGLANQYNKAKDDVERDKALQEIIKHFKGAPNPGALAETFFPNIQKLKEQRKPLPGGLGVPGGPGEKTLFGIQEAVARGAAKGFSPKNLSGFFDKLTKGDQLDAFTAAASRINIGLDNFSEASRKWLETSPGARNLGVGLETFGIRGGGRGGGTRAPESFIT